MGVSRIALEGKKKSKDHATTASSPGAAAQPGAQADAGCAFGFVVYISRRAA